MKQIESIDDIHEFADEIVVIEFKWNLYKNGMARMWSTPESFSHGGYGYALTMAVGEDGVHSKLSITDKDIEKGKVKIRLATLEEISNAVPSYGEIWNGEKALKDLLSEDAENG